MSQFPGGGPDFKIEGMVDMLMDHDDTLRKMKDAEVTILPGRPGYKAQKSRGVYLQWLDDKIAWTKERWDEPPHALEALREARKAFTDEFYPK
jgi:hypothetical protein